jgi:hypothetical protein
MEMTGEDSAEYVGGRPADAELAEDREEEATQRVRKKI